MSLFGITVLLGIASLVAISHGQCIRIRSGNGSQQQSCGQQSCSSCGTTIEDLTALLTIIRALEERETPKPGILNVEEIILQLVNALVYATTNKGCNTGGVISGGGTGGTGGIGGIGGTGGMGGIGGMGGTGGMGGPGGTGGTGGIGGSGGTGLPGNTGIVPPTTNPEYPDDSGIVLDLLQPGTDAEHILRLAIAGKKVADVEFGPDNGAVGRLLNSLL